jgi:glucose-6-phosphate isomerase
MLKLHSKNINFAQIAKKHEKKIAKAQTKLESRKFAEFMELPKQDLSPILDIAKPLVGKYSHIVVVGMGGSILGSQMLFRLLKEPKHNLFNEPKFLFIDTLDPRIVRSYEEILDKKKTLFIFVSKSGGTLETKALFDLIHGGAKKWFGPSWKKHFLIMTENPEGDLYKTAIKDELMMVPLPKHVGGRYSVLTAAGLIPAILMGIDPKKLLKGASKKNLVNRLAAVFYEMYKQKGKKSLVFFPYIDGFEYFNKWAIQLIAESLGKNSKTGPLPVSLLGPSDQHSVLQLLLDGPKDKWVTFFDLTKYPKDYRVGKLTFNQILQAEKIGTSKAMDAKKVPNLSFTLEKLDEESIGQLIQTFEEAVALVGEMLGINPFNQPAVELGKKKTKAILK